MFTLSRKLFYAVEAVFYIAYNANADPVSSKEIAERQGLPPRYLEQMMQKLVRASILRGVRGPRGGYLLAKERRKITVHEICDVLSEANENEDIVSTKLGTEVLKPLWKGMSGGIEKQFQQVTIADLCEKASEQKIRKTADEKVEFSI